MTAPEQSAWLSKSTAPVFCHPDVTDSSEPVQSLSDSNLKNISDSNDLVLEAIRSSESLSWHMEYYESTLLRLSWTRLFHFLSLLLRISLGTFALNWERFWLKS